MDKIKRFLPHLLAVIIFVTTSFIYFSPTIDGTKVLVQNDIVQYQKKNKEVKDYREATGKEALWTSRVFSGMPTFLMGITYPNNYMIKVDALLKLGMPHPTKFLFLSFVCYYFMLIVFGFDIWISVLGALMFGFGSYFFTILEAGHNTKALAIAYMAPVVAGFHLVMKKKYLIGGAIMVFAMALELKANHFQITYYLILLIGLWLVIDAVYSFIKKDYTKPVIAAGLLLLSVALGVGTNATKIWSTYDYAKHSIRGGESELQKKAEETKSGGLDFDYATRWSYGMAETFTLLIPNFYGGASRQELTTKSITYERMVDKGVPKGQAKSFIKSVPLYWGPQPFTSGPVYFGALACFLFVVGMFLFKKESPFYIWVVTAMVLSIMLSWGRHMEWFYDIFFTYFPFFNKFRVPSMILVVTQFVVVLMAITTLKRFISGDNKEELTNALKWGTIVTAGFCAAIALLGPGFFDFKGSADAQLAQSGSWLVDAIKDERESFMRLDSLRSLAFILLGAALIWGYVKEKVNKPIMIIGLCALVVIDMAVVDKRYLNNSNFQPKRKYEQIFKPSQADNMILQDKDPHYRVFNLSGDPFNDGGTSYYHEHIGGYHAAKLIRYQDLIEHHLSKTNMNVINMLNTRYFIVKGKDGQGPTVQANRQALGNVWAIKNIKWAANADEEINALTDFDPATQVVIDKRYEKYMDSFTYQDDPYLGIKLLEFSPNEVKYTSSSSKELFAVFSEVYYDYGAGWNAYIDGQPVEHIRVNYILRGMRVPGGDHEVVFKFEPKTYLLGEKISMAFSLFVIGGALAILILFLIRGRKNEEVTEEVLADA